MWQVALGLDRRSDYDERMGVDQLDALQFSIVAPVWDKEEERYPFRVARILRCGRPHHFILKVRQICGPQAFRTALLAQGVATYTIGRRAFDLMIMQRHAGLNFESCRVPVDEATAYCDRLNQGGGV